MDKKEQITVALADFTFVYTHVPTTGVGKDVQLRYQVTLKYKDREVLTTPFSMGLANVEGYAEALRKTNSTWGRTTLDGERLNIQVCTSGCGPRAFGQGNRVWPKDADVMYCLLMESDVVNYRGFEDWAESLGYDTDSRKAEASYRGCLDTALKLTNSIEKERLEQLKEAFDGY